MRLQEHSTSCSKTLRASELKKALNQQSDSDESSDENEENRIFKRLVLLDSQLQAFEKLQAKMIQVYDDIEKTNSGDKGTKSSQKFQKIKDPTQVKEGEKTNRFKNHQFKLNDVKLNKNDNYINSYT